MKKVKYVYRTVCAMLCAVVVFALVGCGSNGDRIDELQSKIDELQTQIEELQSYFYPDGHIYEKDEPAMIFSNGLPLVKVTYIGFMQTVDGTRFNFTIENTTNTYLDLAKILAFCGATNERVSSTCSYHIGLAPKETVNYYPAISTNYDFVYCGFPSAYHAYGTSFNKSNVGVIPVAIFRVNQSENVGSLESSGCTADFYYPFLRLETFYLKMGTQHAIDYWVSLRESPYYEDDSTFKNVVENSILAMKEKQASGYIYKPTTKTNREKFLAYAKERGWR